MRDLAYPIEKQGRGFYNLVQYQASAGTSEELERLMRLSDEVMRCMTVVLDEDVQSLARTDEPVPAPEPEAAAAPEPESTPGPASVPEAAPESAATAAPETESASATSPEPAAEPAEEPKEVQEGSEA